MLRAVFVRTLKAGVTYPQFQEAWAPADMTRYPARVTVSRSLTNERQVITILELDMSLAEFKNARAWLARPDALERLAEIVETTELEGLYEDVSDNGTPRGLGG